MHSVIQTFKTLGIKRKQGKPTSMTLSVLVISFLILTSSTISSANPIISSSESLQFPKNYIYIVSNNGKKHVVHDQIYTLSRGGSIDTHNDNDSDDAIMKYEKDKKQEDQRSQKDSNRNSGLSLMSAFRLKEEALIEMANETDVDDNNEKNESKRQPQQQLVGGAGAVKSKKSSESSSTDEKEDDEPFPKSSLPATTGNVATATERLINEYVENENIESPDYFNVDDDEYEEYYDGYEDEDEGETNLVGSDSPKEKFQEEEEQKLDIEQKLPAGPTEEQLSHPSEEEEVLDSESTYSQSNSREQIDRKKILENLVERSEMERIREQVSSSSSRSDIPSSKIVVDDDIEDVVDDLIKDPEQKASVTPRTDSTTSKPLLLTEKPEISPDSVETETSTSSSPPFAKSFAPFKPPEADKEESPFISSGYVS